MINRLKEVTRPFRFLLRKLQKGEWLSSEVPFSQLHFSQFGEDLVLQSVFSNRTNGLYLDIGAFHPMLFSNTYLLHKRGWRGCNVDANPASIAAFQQFRPNDLNLSCAIGTNDTRADFWCAGPYSSLRQEAAAISGIQPSRITVESKRLDTLASELPDEFREIDLLTIDCEGSDLDVLRSNDWSKLRPRCVVVESTSNEEVSGYLVKCGYTRLIRMGLSEIFLSEAMKHH